MVLLVYGMIMLLAVRKLIVRFCKIVGVINLEQQNKLLHLKSGVLFENED